MGLRTGPWRTGASFGFKGLWVAWAGHSGSTAGGSRGSRVEGSWENHPRAAWLGDGDPGLACTGPLGGADSSPGRPVQEAWAQLQDGQVVASSEIRTRIAQHHRGACRRCFPSAMESRGPQEGPPSPPNCSPGQMDGTCPGLASRVGDTAEGLGGTGCPHFLQGRWAPPLPSQDPHAAAEVQGHPPGTPGSLLQPGAAGLSARAVVKCETGRARAGGACACPVCACAVPLCALDLSQSHPLGETRLQAARWHPQLCPRAGRCWVSCLGLALLKCPGPWEGGQMDGCPAGPDASPPPPGWPPRRTAKACGCGGRRGLTWGSPATMGAVPCVL